MNDTDVVRSFKTSIWRWRWNRGNKKEARYGNKQAVGTKIFVE